MNNHLYMTNAAAIYQLLDDLRQMDDPNEMQDSEIMGKLTQIVSDVGLKPFLISTSIAMSQCVSDIPPTRWVQDEQEKQQAQQQADSAATFTVSLNDKDLLS